MAFVRKITVKNVCGNVKKLAPEEGKPSVQLMRVVGVVNSVKHGMSEFGGEPSPWVKFLGMFRAVNLLTGEEFRAATCLLPGIGADMLLGAVEGSEGQPVEFAFEIGVAHSDNAVGYEYTLEPLLEPDQGDRLAELDAKALGAPESKGYVYGAEAEPETKPKRAGAKG